MAHHAALKEREALPDAVFQEFGAVEEAIRINPYAPEFVRKREAGWGRRTVLEAETTYQGTHYRMAWEVVDADNIVVWAYGSHEGFHRRLARRARQ